MQAESASRKIVKFADWKFRYFPKIWERDMKDAKLLQEELSADVSLSEYVSGSKLKKSALANIVFGSQGYAADREAALLRITKNQALDRLATYLAGMKRARATAKQG